MEYAIVGIVAWLIGLLIVVWILQAIFVNPITRLLKKQNELAERQIQYLNHIDEMIAHNSFINQLPPPIPTR